MGGHEENEASDNAEGDAATGGVRSLAVKARAGERARGARVESPLVAALTRLPCPPRVLLGAASPFPFASDLPRWLPAMLIYVAVLRV